MATALHGANVGLLMNGYDMASFFYEFDIEASQAMHDATVFGNTSRVKVPGLKDGKASGSAFFDATDTTGSWDILKGMLTGAVPGTANPAIVTLAPNGFAVGNPVRMVYLQEVQLNPKIVVDDLIKLMFSGEAEQDSIDFGVSLHAIGAETVFTFEGTAVDNAAATANGGVGVLNVTAIAGGDPNVTFRVQHSTDNAVWVDLVTFTATTAANTSQRIEVAAGTTVRRYLRIHIVEGGTTTSVTFQASFARR